MHKLEEQFAKWTELDRRLKGVQIRLHEDDGGSGCAAPELAEEFARLDRQCRIALFQLIVEYGRAKRDLGQDGVSRRRIG